MEIKYSIIIPHKNTPELLKRCLNSIPRKNYIQIIVVDDNSDPEIVDFNHFPGANDNFVEVIFTKEGRGAGYARNVGLERVTGNWVLFADSDDFFNKNFLSEIEKYFNSDYDIVYFNIDCVLSENTSIQGSRPRSKILDEYYQIYTNDRKKGEQLYRFNFTEPWAKMIKTELIKKNAITFDETLVANDYLFSVKTGFYASRIHVSSEIIYVLTERENSLSSNFASSYYKLKKRIEAVTQVHLFLTQNNIPYRISPLSGMIAVLLKRYPLRFFEQMIFLKKKRINIFKLLYGIFLAK